MDTDVDSGTQTEQHNGYIILYYRFKSSRKKLRHREPPSPTASLFCAPEPWYPMSMEPPSPTLSLCCAPEPWYPMSMEPPSPTLSLCCAPEWYSKSMVCLHCTKRKHNSPWRQHKKRPQISKVIKTASSKHSSSDLYPKHSQTDPGLKSPRHSKSDMSQYYTPKYSKSCLVSKSSKNSKNCLAWKSPAHSNNDLPSKSLKHSKSFLNLKSKSDLSSKSPSHSKSDLVSNSKCSVQSPDDNKCLSPKSSKKDIIGPNSKEYNDTSKKRKWWRRKSKSPNRPKSDYFTPDSTETVHVSKDNKVKSNEEKRSKSPKSQKSVTDHSSLNSDDTVKVIMDKKKRKKLKSLQPAKSYHSIPSSNETVNILEIQRSQCGKKGFMSSRSSTDIRSLESRNSLLSVSTLKNKKSSENGCSTKANTKKSRGKEKSKSDSTLCAQESWLKRQISKGNVPYPSSCDLEFATLLNSSETIRKKQSQRKAGTKSSWFAKKPKEQSSKERAEYQMEHGEGGTEHTEGFEHFEEFTETQEKKSPTAAHRRREPKTFHELGDAASDDFISCCSTLGEYISETFCLLIHGPGPDPKGLSNLLCQMVSSVVALGQDACDFVKLLCRSFRR